MDIGKEAPTLRPEDLPLLGGPPPSAPDDDDDSDGNQYPEYRGYIPPKPNSMIIPDVAKPTAPVSEAEPSTSVPDESDKSATTKPTAQVSVLEPTALGMDTRTELSTMEMINAPLNLPPPTMNQTRSEDEVSLGDDLEPMGPQISVPATDPDIRMSDTAMEDRLEFALSHLMLYGIPSSEDFAAVQTLVTTIALRLNLTVIWLFRVTTD